MRRVGDELVKEGKGELAKSVEDEMYGKAKIKSYLDDDKGKFYMGKNS